MKFKNIFFSKWMLFVIGCTFWIFAYIVNMEVSEAIPIDSLNLSAGGIAYMWIIGLHYTLLVIKTIVYFSIFWMIIYGIYFLFIMIDKYRNRK